MDLFDILWNSSQDGNLRDLDHQLDRVRLDQDLSDRDFRQLRAENFELKRRLALLVRLLISKGVISASDYAELIVTQDLES